MASLTQSAVELVTSALEMPARFADVVMHDPLFNGVLVLFGALFVGAASAALGYLSLGAFLSLFDIDTSPPSDTQQ